MRILIGTGLNAGAAEYQNIGDVAMLQVAVARLAELWPNAEILVLTDSPADLARFCPAARPLSRYGAETWIGDQVLLGPFHRTLPESFLPYLSNLERNLAHRSPGLHECLLHTRLRLRDSSGRLPKLQSFLKALRSCELLVICGAGGFADSCRNWNLYTLGLIESALANGTRVALFGQGIGPLSDRETLSRMRDTLPRVSMLSLRGNRGATDIAKHICVQDEILLTTGDEAIEPAYQARPTVLGNSIGVNLRIAPYSGATESQADSIGSVLREFAARQSTTLIPLPIAFHSFSDDRESIRRLMGVSTCQDAMVGLDSPQSLYASTATCRIVVTGAYHAAVFALSQGIPTICLSASDYYAAKFEGLQTLFGDGCTIVNLKEEDMISCLNGSIEASWMQANECRPALLSSACSQIALSREAYRRVGNLFSSANQSASPKAAALSIP